MFMHEYVRKILTARVYDVAIESPLDPMPRLSQRLNNIALLKREDLQPVFSFKLRGAYNKMVGLSPEVRERGVVCASAGNHAQAVARHASLLGIKATIVMPRFTPATKVVRTAIQNAASVAALLITTEAMVAELPKKGGAGPAMPPGAGMGGMDF